MGEKSASHLHCNRWAVRIFIFAIGPLTSPAHAALTCAQGGNCSVGQVGPGGGFVFYVNNSGFTCGPAQTQNCTYLEVAPYGWPAGGGGDPRKVGAISRYLETQATAAFDTTPDLTLIGGGAKNTKAIIDQGNNTTDVAAFVAQSYNGGGKTDWYLANGAESNQLCQWASGVESSTVTLCTGETLNNAKFGASTAGFTADYYQTSSELNVSIYWEHQFGTANGHGTFGGGRKSSSYLVRPIRAFSNSLPANPAFTLSSSSEQKTVGTAINGYTISSTGGAIDSYSISPAAPAGLTFNTSSGLLTGAPLNVASATTYTITGTNASGSATATYALTVNAASTSNSVQAAADAAAQVQKDKDTANVLGTLVLAIGSIQQGLAIITRAAINPGKKQVPAISAKKAKAARVNPKPKPTTKP